MQNQRFEIRKNSIEISGKNSESIIEGISLSATDQEPEIVENCESIEMAKLKLQEYHGSIRELSGSATPYYLVTEYYIEENVYDERGEWLDGGNIWEFAPNNDLLNFTQEKQRLLVDMDGTAAVFKSVDTLETLYEEGYFLNLDPNENVVEAVRNIIENHPEIEVYIMSAVLTDSHYALTEKNLWLDKYLPEIDLEHRIFPPCGENKLDYVPNGIRPNDFLLDDYTKNLVLWEPPAKGIKLLNGINHTNQSWQGNMLRFDRDGGSLANDIVEIMEHGKLIQDMRPQDKEMLEQELHPEAKQTKKMPIKHNVKSPRL